MTCQPFMHILNISSLTVDEKVIPNNIIQNDLSFRIIPQTTTTLVLFVEIDEILPDRRHNIVVENIKLLTNIYCKSKNM